MQIDYSITTNQQKESVLDVLSFLTSIDLLKDGYCFPSEVKDKAAGQLVLINIIGNKRMRTLNNSYREKNASTDVLSFELYEAGVMGELYICPDDINKNAKMLNHPFENELIEIIVHGILHLAGHDHSEQMFSWQKEITERILTAYEDNRRTR